MLNKILSATAAIALILSGVFAIAEEKKEEKTTVTTEEQTVKTQEGKEEVKEEGSK